MVAGVAGADDIFAILLCGLTGTLRETDGARVINHNFCFGELFKYAFHYCEYNLLGETRSITEEET